MERPVVKAGKGRGPVIGRVPRVGLVDELNALG